MAVTLRAGRPGRGARRPGSDLVTPGRRAAAVATATAVALATALVAGTVALWSVDAPEGPTLAIALVAGGTGSRLLAGIPRTRFRPDGGAAPGPAPTTDDGQLRTVLRVVCHEFRTPVAALRAVARVLGPDDGSLDEESRRRAVALVGAHAEHLAAMLDAVHRADEALCGRPDTVPPAVTTVADLVAASAAAAGVTGSRLDVRLGDAPAAVRTDAAGLRRILTNLFENAARHGGGGTITVAVRCAGDRLVLEVGDRGPGPTQAVAAVLGTGADTSSPPASGLGLWIVRRLAEGMGGSVTAGPRRGGGLLVRVVVPVG